MTAPTRRLLPEVAAAAVPGAVLVARPAGTVRHVAVTAGLTRQGRLRRTERPVCGRPGRASWSTRRGAGRPLCHACDSRVRATTSRDELIAAARTLAAPLLADVLAAATTLDQVDTVAGLLAADPALRTSMHPARWGQESLQALVRHARDRLTPRPARPAAGGRREVSAPPLERAGMYPTRYPARARRAS